MMYWWSVTLNAISLVNLVMASGISVEFCSHIIRDFALNTKPVSSIQLLHINIHFMNLYFQTNNERAQDTVINMGAVLFSGIHVTNFLGVIVLAFAQYVFIKRVICKNTKLPFISGPRSSVFSTLECI